MTEHADTTTGQLDQADTEQAPADLEQALAVGDHDKVRASWLRIRRALTEGLRDANYLRATADLAEQAKPTIHQAMAAVMADVGAVGKGGTNREQGYAFRQVDDFMNALHPAMARHGVFVTPCVEERLVEERTNSRGTAIRLVDLRIRFTFHGPAGDSVDAVTWGEAKDSSDKATNKAMTAAFKYALLQTFMIPLVDMEDADRTSPEAPSQEEAARVRQEEAEAAQAWVAEVVAAAGDEDALRSIWRRAAALRGHTVTHDGQTGTLGELIRQAATWPPTAPPQPSEPVSVPEQPEPVATPEQPAPPPSARPDDAEARQRAARARARAERRTKEAGQ